MHVKKRLAHLIVLNSQFLLPHLNGGHAHVLTARFHLPSFMKQHILRERLSIFDDLVRRYQRVQLETRFLERRLRCKNLTNWQPALTNYLKDIFSKLCHLKDLIVYIYLCTECLLDNLLHFNKKC